MTRNAHHPHGLETLLYYTRLAVCSPRRAGARLTHLSRARDLSSRKHVLPLISRRLYKSRGGGAKPEQKAPESRQKGGSSLFFFRSARANILHAHAPWMRGAYRDGIPSGKLLLCILQEALPAIQIARGSEIWPRDCGCRV